MFDYTERDQQDDDAEAIQIMRRLKGIDRRYRILPERALMLLLIEGQQQILTEIRAMAVDTSRIDAAVTAIGGIIDGLKANVATLTANEAVAGDTEAQSVVNSIADKLEILDGHVTTVAAAAGSAGDGTTPPSVPPIDTGSGSGTSGGF